MLSVDKSQTHKRNIKLLAKVLHQRRRAGKADFTSESWGRYIQRLKQRFNTVKEDALRTKHLSPEEMFLNFLDLVGSLEQIKQEVG